MAPAAKRTHDSVTQGGDAPGIDEVVIRPLGAGQEVGRSCFVLRYQGKGVMFDCGIHPAHSGTKPHLFRHLLRHCLPGSYPPYAGCALSA